MRASASRAAQSLVVDAPAGEERKVVSVLFVDLVGFTSRSDRADPEDVRATLRPYHERVKADIERFGGTVEKFIGDAVMAVFGAPVAHEDDAERAVRSGAPDPRDDRGAARGRARARGARRGDDGRGGRRARRAPGARRGHRHGRRREHGGAPAVRSAGRRACSSTRRRCARPRARSRSSRSSRSRRRARRSRSRSGARSDARSRVGQPEAATHTPFVGREHERTLLLETFLRAERESSVQLVTVVGEPGIGKSRLVTELRTTLDDRPDLVTWRHGRCLPYGEGITFWALGEIVKAEAGILESDDQRRRAVEARRDRRGRSSTDESERAWFDSRLAPLVGAGGDGRGRRPGGGVHRLAPVPRGAGGAAAVRPRRRGPPLGGRRAARLPRAPPRLEHARAAPPALHRAPGALRAAARAGAEGSATRRRSRSRRSRAEESGRLLQVLLDRTLLPAETQAALLERAGGNPLYAEQFARMLAERGDVEGLAVPETVQALIAARLDTLRPELKALLHDAAVVGQGVLDRRGRRGRRSASATTFAAT